MTSDQIGPETKIVHDPSISRAQTADFGLGFAVRTSPPPSTTWPLGEYRWDGAGGSFYFVDPKDDLLGVFMQCPDAGRADPAGAEDDDVRSAGQGTTQERRDASIADLSMTRANAFRVCREGHR